MPIADDIAAIRADGSKTEEQKRRDIYRLKCQSLYDALLPFKGSTYRYNSIDWTIWDLWLEDDGATLCLTVRAVGTGNQSSVIRIRPQRVYRFVNPPVLTRAGTDDRLTAAREMIAGLL